MAWVFLGIAGLLEVVWAYFMKTSNGFTKPMESVATIVAMVISFWLLSLAMKELPLGTAYAVWTGIGAAGTALIGILYYGEPAGTARLVLLTILIGSIMGLKLVSAE